MRRLPVGGMTVKGVSDGALVEWGDWTGDVFGRSNACGQVAPPLPSLLTRPLFFIWISTRSSASSFPSLPPLPIK